MPNHDQWGDPNPIGDIQLSESIANRLAKICIDCQLEDSDPTRFDGNYCVSCANYAETTIR
jgi:hypothetical protein